LPPRKRAIVNPRLWIHLDERRRSEQLHGQRDADPFSRECPPRRQIGQDQVRDIGIGHRNLADALNEMGRCENTWRESRPGWWVDRETVDRNPHGPEPDRFLVYHRAGTTEPPVQTAARKTLKVLTVQLVVLGDERKLETFQPRLTHVEQGRTSHEPAYWRMCDRFCGPDDPINQRGETFTVSHIACGIDQNITACDQTSQVRVRQSGKVATVDL